MRKLKIYISKSKEGRFNDIMKLKGILENFNVEVLEFIGGKYSADKLLSADILLTLPPIRRNLFYVDKGQYTELNEYTDKDFAHCFVVYPDETTVDGELKLSQVTALNRVDEHICNWKNNYGELHYDTEKLELEDILIETYSQLVDSNSKLRGEYNVDSQYNIEDPLKIKSNTDKILENIYGNEIEYKMSHEIEILPKKYLLINNKK